MQSLDPLELAILTRLLNTGRYQCVYVKAIEFGAPDDAFARAVCYLSKRGLIDVVWKDQTPSRMLCRLFRKPCFDQCFGRITEHGLNVVLAG